ncbi:MAG: FIST C-terminal domain-containing protein [Lachnospiraceae bacterium]|nr:FIST C-terminal domain-containing protein [Lachnospiraceae bacterium]
MSRCISVMSINPDAAKAVEEVCAKIDAEVELPKALLFFSNREIFAEAAKMLSEKYPSTISMGSTTYMNLIEGKMSHAGLSVMAIFSGVEVSCGYLEEISRHPMNYDKRVTDALNNLESTQDTICIEFTPAFLIAEEFVLDTFYEALKGTNVGVIGGSTGGKFGEKETMVSLNGEVYKDATVFMFIRNLKGKIALYRENMYKLTDKQLVVTDVDISERKVYEFNDRPALQVMKEIFHATDEDILKKLDGHPIGRLEGNDVLITDINSINDDGSFTYLARVYNMTKVSVLEMDNLKKVWDKTTNECRKLIKNPEFALVVNCAGRTKTFENMGVVDEFADRMTERFPTFVTLSGFGEQLNEFHFNKTMVLAMFE